MVLLSSTAVCIIQPIVQKLEEVAELDLSHGENHFYVSEVLVCISSDFSVTNGNDLCGCKTSFPYPFCVIQRFQD